VVASLACLALLSGLLAHYPEVLAHKAASQFQGSGAAHKVVKVVEVAK
jgi:hypothetical protein